MGRYSKVFSLPQNLYATGSPVLISAGALQKDNQSGNVLAQLKLKNISSRKIKAVKVSIQPFDTVGKSLGELVSHTYLDLTATRDSEFGQKTPIALPDSSTRSFSVSVDEVVFTDNSTWTASGEPWETLKPAQTLQSQLTYELAKQFRMEFGEVSQNLLCEQKDLWICSCGTINRADEPACHRCNTSLSALRSIDFTEMQKRCDERVAKEEQQKKEAEKAAAKAKKKKAIIAGAIGAVAAVVAGVVIIIQVVIPSVKYNSAVKLLESGQYDEAVAAFEAMGDYKDSADMITEVRYQEALYLMQNERYSEAVAAFDAMGDYKDSADMAIEVRYQNAVALMNNSQYVEAIELFEELGDYKESAENAVFCNEKNQFVAAKVGSYITFGTYEQDGDTTNGTEDIEWLVLDKSDDKLLVISRYALISAAYSGYTWQSSAARTDLNSGFLHSAFTVEEQSQIASATVTADPNPSYNTNVGEDTNDKVFLLSIDEVNRYFSDDSSRICFPTVAVSNETLWTGNMDESWWWLRTPGEDSQSTSFVTLSGSIYENGYDMSSSGWGKLYNDGMHKSSIHTYRPAMWINIE